MIVYTIRLFEYAIFCMVIPIHNKKWTYSIAKEIMSFEFKYYVEEFQNSSMRGWDNFHDGFQFGRKLFWSKYKQSYYYDYFFCWIVSKPFNYIMHYRTFCYTYVMYKCKSEKYCYWAIFEIHVFWLLIKILRIKLKQKLIE